MGTCGLLRGHVKEKPLCHEGLFGPDGTGCCSAHVRLAQTSQQPSKLSLTGSILWMRTLRALYWNLKPEGHFPPWCYIASQSDNDLLVESYFPSGRPMPVCGAVLGRGKGGFSKPFSSKASLGKSHSCGWQVGTVTSSRMWSVKECWDRGLEKNRAASMGWSVSLGMCVGCPAVVLIFIDSRLYSC